MAGVPHDVLVLALKEKPELLAELLQRVAGVTLPGPLAVTDSVVRFTVSLETYPDLVFTTEGPEPSWVIVELQNRPDETKGKTWHLATSVLLQNGVMGDLVVITASRSVARWARQVAQHRGALGTTKGLTPVVVHVSKKDLAALLDPARPELALFAVWARCRGAGAEAKRVATRALEVTRALPSELQEAQTRAILAMLSERLLGYLKELSMDVNQIKETKASRAFRLFFEKRGRELGKAEGLAAGLAEGKRSALLAVLAARGLPPTEPEGKQIAALSDLELLDRCLQAAVTCTTVAEALAPLQGHLRPRPRAPRGTTKVNGHRR